MDPFSFPGLCFTHTSTDCPRRSRREAVGWNGEGLHRFSPSTKQITRPAPHFLFLSPPCFLSHARPAPPPRRAITPRKIIEVLAKPAGPVMRSRLERGRSLRASCHRGRGGLGLDFLGVERFHEARRFAQEFTKADVGRARQRQRILRCLGRIKVQHAGREGESASFTSTGGSSRGVLATGGRRALAEAWPPRSLKGGWWGGILMWSGCPCGKWLG